MNFLMFKWTSFPVKKMTLFKCCFIGVIRMLTGRVTREQSKRAVRCGKKAYTFII